MSCTPAAAAAAAATAAAAAAPKTDTKPKRGKFMVFIVKTGQNAAILRIFDVLRSFCRLWPNDDKEAENTQKSLKIGEKMAPDLEK